MPKRLALVLSAGLLAASLSLAIPAEAESCTAHLARTGSTAAADRAYHAAHKGESPCEQPDKESGTVHPTGVERRSEGQSDGDKGRKSRYCRKHIWC